MIRYCIRVTYSMYTFNFWVYFSIFVGLNVKFAISVNKRTEEGRILHGKNASILHNAHAVLLQVTKKNLASHICGSSVLNQKFLLTAAHCFNVKGNYTTLAFAGHEDIRKLPIMRPALRVVVNKKFKIGHNVDNDIALVVLNKELPLGTTVKRIIVNRKFPRDVTGILAGWGTIDEDTLQGTTLLKLLTQKVRHKECDFVKPTPHMFCAGSMIPSNPSPSFGDSGSGLVTKKFQIIGILSYKLTEYPALPVYSNVSYFYSWIKKTTLKYC